MTDGPLHDQRTDTQHGSLVFRTEFGGDRVADVRRALTDCLRGAGLRGARLDDFVAAINEVMTNAVRHGGGWGEVRLLRRPVHVGDVGGVDLGDGGDIGDVGDVGDVSAVRPSPVLPDGNRAAGDAIVCEIRDRGRGFADPLTIPSARPRPSAKGGMGLWLAQELADSIEVESGADGVRVRLVMSVAGDEPTGINGNG